MARNNTATTDAQIESTLIFDVGKPLADSFCERVAEGIHERGDRKTEYLYTLDTETDETILRVQTRYYLEDELKNESGRNTEEYTVVDRVVQTNDQVLHEFIRANFNADPEVSLGDEFESMVDEV